MRMHHHRENQCAVLQIPDETNFSKKIRRGSNQLCTYKKIWRIIQHTSKCMFSVVYSNLSIFFFQKE